MTLLSETRDTGAVELPGAEIPPRPTEDPRAGKIIQERAETCCWLYLSREIISSLTI